MSEKDIFLYNTVLLEIIHPTKHCQGTGFIVRFDINDKSHDIIITNKHVIKDVMNGGKLVLNLKLRTQNGHFSGFKFIIENPEIISHPDDQIDLCGIDLENQLPIIRGNLSKISISLELYYVPISEKMFFDGSELFPRQEILMIGYPMNAYDDKNILPSYRGGYTSSHPNWNYKNLPHILTDCACFPGSSGSPVFLYDQGLSRTPNGCRLLFDPNKVASRFELLGILSSGPIKESTIFMVDNKNGNKVGVMINGNTLFVENDLHSGIIIKANQLLVIKGELNKMLAQQKK